MTTIQKYLEAVQMKGFDGGESSVGLNVSQSAPDRDSVSIYTGISGPEFVSEDPEEIKALIAHIAKCAGIKVVFPIDYRVGVSTGDLSAYEMRDRMRHMLMHPSAGLL